MPRLLKILLLSAFLFFTVSLRVLAQENSDGDKNTFGEVISVSINDKDGKDGDIMILTGNEVQLSSREYQNVAIGVINSKPAFSLKPSNNTLNITSNGSTAYSVVISGNAMVNVSQKNGAITKGDLITTSDVKGVGMKAVKSGYVLGTALDDFKSDNKDEVKQIRVAISVHHFSEGSSIVTNISDVFKLAALAAYENPKLAMRYAVIMILVVVTIFFTFVSYAKVARLGIVAMARNPLAKGKVLQTVLINAGLTLIIIAAGVAGSFLVTRIG